MRHSARGILRSMGLARPVLRTGGRRDACPTASAFTLIETLVAVGALAFVAVGVAVIFEATGKTITTGKRVSAFSAYAAAIEHQMRADISGITREGFLVIRNEYADRNGDGTINDPADRVPLYAGESPARQRLRRTDELMFFAKGDFVSARGPLVPGFVARSDAARIYYGHGQRRLRDMANYPNNPYARPPVSDVNNGTANASSQLGYDDANNPNRYASDWTLLRHVTLLAPPQAALRPASAAATALGITSVDDSDLQVALQPAASHIFRQLATIFPAATTGNEVHPMPGGYPAISSGIVDLATTNLSQIRSVIVTADQAPGATVDGTFFDPTSNSQPDGGGNTGVDGQFRVGLNGANNGLAALGRMQAWMDDALPTWSDADTYTSSGTASDRCRIRYEPAPTDFAGVLKDSSPSGPLTALESELYRADQLMLSSANFVPRCTEFIVEWSFGDRYTDPTDLTGTHPRGVGYTGEVIWHGMSRTASQVGADGQLDIQHQLANPFKIDPPTGTPNTWDGLGYQARTNNGALSLHPYTAKLIHGVSLPTTLASDAPVTSFFGYLDPTYTPDKNNNGTADDPGDTTPATVPCPWPAMIRVTISLADPADPSVERTFQFVFDVPQAGAN